MTSGELELTDYRSTVSELYAAVRAEDDPKQAAGCGGGAGTRLFRSHPQSPLPPGGPLRATGLPYWPTIPVCVSAAAAPGRQGNCRSVPTSDG
jgi:hypothetical protein